MSVKITLSAKEKAELKKELNRLTLVNRKAVEDSMSAAGLDMQNQAREMAPVDTGRLRQSIRMESIDDKLGTRVSTNVEYAAEQNNGNSKRAGKHFMEGGFAAGVQRLLRTLRIR